jgi:hypothetical protein
MAEKDWLQKLKVGDEVAVCYSRGFYGRRYEFRKVDRINTRFIVVSGNHYRIDSGDQPGYRSQIVESTAELKAEIAATNRRRFLEQALDNVTWRNLTDEQLETVYAALPAIKK